MNPFLRVIDALNRHQVRYVIVGGFAAVMHGYPRATYDLDLVVDLQPDEARKAISALVSLGMEPRVPVDPFHFADPVQREAWVREKQARVFSLKDPSNPVFVVDLFIEPTPEGERLFDSAKTIQIHGRPCRICSLEHLIAMKRRAGRPQDLVDIEALTAIQSSCQDGTEKKP